MPVNTEKIALRLPPSLRADLEKLAAADRRTPSDYARLLLSDAVAAKRAQPQSEQRRGVAA